MRKFRLSPLGFFRDRPKGAKQVSRSTFFPFAESPMANLFLSVGRIVETSVLLVDTQYVQNDNNFIQFSFGFSELSKWVLDKKWMDAAGA